MLGVPFREYEVEKWNDYLSVELYVWSLCLHQLHAGPSNKRSFIGYLLAADDLVIVLHAMHSCLCYAVDTWSSVN